MAQVHHIPDVVVRAGTGLREVALTQWRLRRQPSHLALHGVRLALEPEWATPTLRQALYEGWYEDHERSVLARTLRDDDVYVELGGGLGYLCTLASRRLGNERVTVYEANPRLAEVIGRTTRANGVSPTIINAALADQDGETDFHLHPDFWLSSLSPVDGATTIRVPTRSFERELHRLAPTYLMVDIEGGETVLLGGHELPDSVRAICVETHAASVGDAAIQRMYVHLIEQGFALQVADGSGDVAFFVRVRD